VSEFLVEPQELLNEAARKDVLFMDGRRSAPYAAGHIPGAVKFTTYYELALDTRPDGLAAFARDMAQRYAAIGVSRGRPVVVYEEHTGMFAARDLWMLQWLGCRDVRMLHGGYAAWKAAGGGSETELVQPVAARFDPEMRDELVIGSAELEKRLRTPGLTVLDVREAAEYEGRDNTPCCMRRGHVPGAVWLEWTDLLEAGRYKSLEEIRKLATEKGVDAKSEIAPYCHRGARSAAAYYALKHAGFPKLRNFLGSWHEWSARTDLPLEKP
jgi:thiosulfate/3-mercaptopyruvate sulfurtransferase